MAMAEFVDPITHLVIPLLVLLAAKQSPRLVVPLAFFAIFPDFDSIVGPHRMVLHNVFVIVLIPLAFLLFARYKRPELLLPGMIAAFYLSSHILLDMDGVAFFYPIDQTAYMFVPHLEFFTAPDFHFAFYVEWGSMSLPAKNEYNLLSSISIAYILFLVLLCVVYRDGVKSFPRRFSKGVKSMLAKMKGILRRDRPS